MIGRVILKNHRTKETKYLFFSNLSDRLLASFRNNSDISLCCDCNDEQIELKVGKREDTYYIHNAKQGYRDKHNPKCPRHSYYSGNSEYDTGWKQDEDNFTATLDSDIFNTGREEEPGVEAPPRPYAPRAKGYVNPTTQKGEVTLLGLVTKLNLIAWERCSRNGNLPDSLEEFLRKVFGTMKKIKLTNKRVESLQEINHGTIKTADIKVKKTFVFVYMRLLKVENDPYNESRVLIYCRNSFGDDKKFYYDKAKFHEVYDNVRFEDLTKQIVFVGGFVYKATDKSSILTFSSMCMFVVNKLGLYCESSYELETYNKLCENKRLFYKPYSSMPEYGDLKPDIIFLDTNKPTIGEVFGFNSPEYLTDRERKLQLAEDLKESYGFWKWDAFNNETIPEFPSVDKIIEKA